MPKTTLKPIIKYQDNGKIRICVPNSEKKLSQKALTGKQRKRITNNRTHTDFLLRQRTTKNGIRGQIKGKYKNKKITSY